MPKVEQLRCRECSRSYPVSAIYVCEFCFAPLEPVYDYEEISAAVSRSSIETGPASIWRYASLLPELDPRDRVDIGAGLTPLIRAENLADLLGIPELYLKNDTANPTHSFKDRVVSVALSSARTMGFKTVACASTGNLANAVAAHAARAGLRSFVFIPADLESAKVVTSAVYGANIVKVKGNYDDVNRLCSEIAERTDWAFVNMNLRPFYSEGSKTLAFELAEQLGWRAPADVVVPVASGSLLTKIDKGFREMVQVGLIEEAPVRIHAAQPSGCSPVVTALQKGSEHISPVKPYTIAKSLAIGNPADGFYAVRTVRRSLGSGEMVTDEEIVDGIRLLASTEGIFTETAGGVTVASLRKLAQHQALSGEGPVVALITGMGLKTAEVLTDRLGSSMEIPPDADVFEEEMKLL